MKLPRLWPDALRQTRLMTWAPLLIPVLVFLMLADRWYPGYVEHRERYIDAKSRLERAQAVAELQPRYQEKITAQTEPFETAKKTALVNDDLEMSIAQLRQHIQSMLTAEFVDEVPQFDITPQPPAAENGAVAGPAVLLGIELRLLMSPQQLAGLEARLLPFKDRMVPVDIDVSVVPDPKRASKQLDVRMRFRAMHLHAAAVAPPVAEAPTEATAKPTSAPTPAATTPKPATPTTPAVASPSTQSTR